MKDCALPIDLDSELAPPPVVLLLNRAVRGPDVIAQGGVGEVEEVRVDADVLQETLAHVDVELRVVVVVDVFGRRAADFANTLVLVALLGFLLVYAVRNTILMHPRLIGATQMNASLVHASMVAGLLLMLRTLLADLCALVPRRRGA